MKWGGWSGVYVGKVVWCEEGVGWIVRSVRGEGSQHSHVMM